MNKFNLELNGNRVAISLDDVGEERSKGGLYVPQTAQGEGPKTGKVAAVSSGYLVNGHHVTSPFKVGDRVMLDTLGATKVLIDQYDYIIVRNEDIVGRYVNE